MTDIKFAVDVEPTFALTFLERGLNCRMNTVRLSEELHFDCVFEWDQEATGIDAYEGHMMVKCTFAGDVKSQHTETTVDVNRSGQLVTAVLPMNGAGEKPFLLKARFHFSLRPFSASELEPLMAANFAVTEYTDGNLIVEGKKIPVNKALLCHHSEFLRNLFATSITRSDCEDVTIESESFKDFVRFLSMIHRRLYFPNEQTAERMLELAERYDVPNVTRQVEQLLTHDIKLPTNYLVYLADKYKLEDLEKTAFGKIKTAAHLKGFRDSAYYDRVSDSTKLEMFKTSFVTTGYHRW